MAWTVNPLPYKLHLPYLPRATYQMQGPTTPPNTPSPPVSMVDANLSPSVRALRAPLREADCEAKLASNFSQRKKWSTVCIIMLVQISMNMNASIYGNAVHDLRSVYGVSEVMSRSGFSIFLCAYAFGCELWAPWSEESGRWKTLQWSLFFVNLWQIPQIFLVL